MTSRNSLLSSKQAAGIPCAVSAKMNQQHYQLSTQIGEILHRHGWQVSTAESCTGGWLARCITDIPGSSAWFETGFVTYSNAAKHRLLGASLELFEGEGAPGAVSAQTVTAMAKGALREANAHFAMATSGIAGPDGGSAEKPVGTVWFGWAWQKPSLAISSHTKCHVFEGDRESVRCQSVTTALEGLLAVLQEQEKTLNA